MPAAIRTTLPDLLANEPWVRVDLLKELPESLAPATWQTLDWQGYQSSEARMFLYEDARPAGAIFVVETLFFVPEPRNDIQAFGVSLHGMGVAVGYITDRFGHPLAGIRGYFPLDVQVLYQNFRRG